MINHLRTLLLNENGSNKADINYPGEEYVPTTFSAQALPSNLRAIYNTLFSPSADRAMKNFRLRQYLTFLHTTELASYVTALDPRITYWPIIDTGLFDSALLSGAIAVLGSSDFGWDLKLLSDPNLVSDGQLYNVWQIAVTSQTQATVTQKTFPFTSTTVALTFTNSISNSFQLPNSELTVGTVSGTNAGFPTWALSHLARPSIELADVYQQLVNTLDLTSIFNTFSEPFKTCLRLWGLVDAPIAYKLGAVVLALGYTLDASYQGAR